MAHLQAQRTLVKSPPELWAEISDEQALGRHLAELGPIRITRVEPEATVAWESASAHGTVALAPAGWGTRVTVDAELSERSSAAELPVATEAELGLRRGTAFGRVARRLRWRTDPATLITTAPPAPPPTHEEPDRALESLRAALESLGSAHHRPFSRG